MRLKLIPRALLFAGIISAVLILNSKKNDASAFNCSGVQLPSNIVICSNTELTKLADERQQIYNETRARLSPDQQKQLWEDQKAWVHSYPAACGISPDHSPPLPAPASVIECFKRAAEGRAAYLRTYGTSTSTAATGPSGSSSGSPQTLESSTTEEVPLKQEGGTFVIPVQINGTITLDFVVDSGATDVQIPIDVFSTLLRANAISNNDIIGKRKFTLADGSTKDVPVFMLQNLKVGHYVVHNVTASVAPVAGSLLLGQSFLSKFAEWALDNDRHVLKLVARSVGPAAPESASTDQPSPTATVVETGPPHEFRPSPQTAFLCGRPVGYSLDPSRGSPNFLGVWIGSWNTSSRLCGGLIVEKAQLGGAAEVIYVYGPSAPGSRLRWKKQHRMAFLTSGGELSFQDDQGSTFAFDLVGSDLLRATFQSRSGRLSGFFQKSR